MNPSRTSMSEAPMTSPDIPTPETDAATYDITQAGFAKRSEDGANVSANFARALERRLAAATARAEKAERIIRNGEEQTAALKRLVPFCHHPANLVIGSAEGWICCECWAQQNEDALRKIAALPTDQTASPTQCEAVLIAMDALEASPSVRPNELQSKLAAAEARAEEAERWKSEALQVEREWDPQELAKMLGGTLGESCRMVVQREVPRLLSELDRLRKEVERLREDKERLDWLEGEIEREGSGLRSLFRLNYPITRAAIDAAMSNPEKQQ